MNAALVIQLVLSLIDRAAAISALLTKAKSENRDVSDDELNALFANDDAAKAALDAAIAAARSKP